MPSVSMRQLLEAGVHFGHQTRRWNPKMRPYIFAERNGIHIIDLAKTVSHLEAALEFVTDTVAGGDTILFVGTKKQAQEPIAEEAGRAEMPYVNQRWLGGMLTNFVTIRKRLGLLDQLEARQASGEFDRLSKKEASHLIDEITRLQRTLGGMRKMRRLPGALFVVDPQRERIAVTEARKLEIPVIGTGDTNVDPTSSTTSSRPTTTPIRAIRLLCRLVADAAIEGVGQRAVRAAAEPPLRRRGQRGRGGQRRDHGRASPRAARTASRPSPTRTRRRSCRAPRRRRRRGGRRRAGRTGADTAATPAATGADAEDRGAA